MKHPRKVTAAILIFTIFGLASVAAAQSPAPPATAKPNPETATAALLAECIKKEQGAAGVTRAAATETCKKRLTTEPALPIGDSPNPTRQEDLSSEVK